MTGFVCVTVSCVAKTKPFKQYKPADLFVWAVCDASMKKSSGRGGQAVGEEVEATLRSKPTVQRNSESQAPPAGDTQMLQHQSITSKLEKDQTVRIINIISPLQCALRST